MSGNSERVRRFSFTRTLRRESMLKKYMLTRFYPPFSYDVIDICMPIFCKYWMRRITYDEFVNSCPIGEQELQDKFSSFLNIEDLKE